MHGRSRTAASAALIIAVLLATGCSSGNGSERAAGTLESTTTTTTTTTTSSAAAGNSVAPPVEPSPPPPPPGAGTDVAALKASLVAAERAIRDPAKGVVELEKAGRQQQDAYRALVDRPEWAAEVLPTLPAPLQEAAKANVAAGTELRTLGKPRTSLPPWRIVAPAPAQELLGHYKAAEAASGIPWQYLAAIHLVETRMGRIRGTSVAGAQGPMQFLPATWRRYGNGGDINANRDAIFAAARLLAANGGPANMANALYRYNPTPRYVKAVTAYAGQMQDNERVYFGYYHWQVYYRLVEGDRLLPVGFGR